MTTLILCWLSLLLGLAMGYGLAALTRRSAQSPILEIHYAAPERPNSTAGQGGQPKPSWPYWEICQN